MADNHSKETRSYNMSRVKGKNTKPELLVRKFLFSKGFRFRLHDKNLPGKPDIILPKYKTIVFINGCFWHGHENCTYAAIPKTRTEWWHAKISNNICRDQSAQDKLRGEGWQVIVIWGCDLKLKQRVKTLEELSNKITSSKT